MSTRREYYKSRAEVLQVPHEIESIPIEVLLRRQAESNIYARCVDISSYAERILAELTQELRGRLQELDMREDTLRPESGRSVVVVEGTKNATESATLEEIRQEVEQYRALPKPALLAMWEAIYGDYERVTAPDDALSS